MPERNVALLAQIVQQHSMWSLERNKVYDGLVSSVYPSFPKLTESCS